jgi:hypothetical protein
MGLSFTIASGPRQPFILRSESLRTHDQILLLYFPESESELLYDLRYTANQFVLAPSPLTLRARILFSQLNTCGHSPYIISPLTGGWFCNLQLLLALASAVILRSEPRGTRDHILLSQIRDFSFVASYYSHEPSSKHRFQEYLYCCMRIRCRGKVFPESLPRNSLKRYNIKTT